MSVDAREPFTWRQYAHYLNVAKERGYEFASFEDAPARRSKRRLLFIRHDIDFSPRWVEPMARLEYDCQARATYCLQPDSRNYSIDAAATKAAVETILELGHWVGLHFDATQIASDRDVLKRVVSDARALGVRFGTEVRTVSFHMPGRRRVDHLKLPEPLISTYSSRFFTEMAYVSDSNQNWRGVDLESLLRRGEHEQLQILIHPMWWRERHEPMLAKLQELAGELEISIDELLTPEQRELIEADG